VQPEEGEQIRTWEKQLKAFTWEQIENFGMIRLTEEADEPGPSFYSQGQPSQRLQASNAKEICCSQIMT